ncbi:hypothetical protein GQ43DRAFT_375335 [Delitschia confertaspora ATCC 74209]|uniref:Autophagy-related protein 3 n=1 Tax=Delitschia confertaspora ATCC 74209 TaxID=1513339 RepID=A0A9P4JK89_9PLEO|nr:hypothetical protein GQ43DRAFT_375335 [Delitschia confertaspora ATCC 74209]
MQISSFPSISSTEFEEACYQLENKFANKKHLQNDWLSVNVVQNHDTKYLRITRVLANKKSQKSDPWEKCESESLEEEEEEEPDPEEFEEDDAEALRHRPSDTDEAVLEYDIILSPSYQVPVLYFSIKDPLFRYPLTTETLYEYIIPEHFRRQISDVGVIGGITLTVSSLSILEAVLEVLDALLKKCSKYSLCFRLEECV